MSDSLLSQLLAPVVALVTTALVAAGLGVLWLVYRACLALYRWLGPQQTQNPPLERHDMAGRESGRKGV